ncbi:MAG: 4Fe-4S binding protein [Bacteroidales bacterium]
MKKGNYFINLCIVVLCMLAVVAYKGKFLGKENSEWFSDKNQEEYLKPSDKLLRDAGYTNYYNIEEEDEGIWILDSKEKGKQTRIVSTKLFSPDNYGFAGPIYSLIYLNHNNTIEKVQIQSHSETPSFIHRIKRRGILTQWENVSLNNYNQFQADVVSGATLSSNAINSSVHESLMGLEKKHHAFWNHIQWNNKILLALAVLLLGVVNTFVKSKKKIMRTIQLSLNTIVLGLYCGQFISLGLLFGWLQNGMNPLLTLSLSFMVALAVIMPLLGKRQFYCSWICPFGSAQELLGKISKKKWSLNSIPAQILKHSRKSVSLILLIAFWMGVSFEILQYEPFAAFIFQSASIGVIVLAIINLILAVKINRPWCRFACPTGQVLSWIEKIK